MLCVTQLPTQDGSVPGGLGCWMKFKITLNRQQTLSHNMLTYIPALIVFGLLCCGFAAYNLYKMK